MEGAAGRRLEELTNFRLVLALGGLSHVTFAVTAGTACWLEPT